MRRKGLKQKVHVLLNFIRLLFVLLIANILPTSVYSAQVVLNAGLPAFPPFAYTDPEKTTPGTVVSLYRMLEKKTGLKFKIHYLPYARLLNSLQDGTLDVAIMFKNHSVKNDVSYIGKISQSKVIIVSTKGNGIHNYDDLYQLKRVAVIRRANYGARFDHDKNIKKISVGNYLQATEMLNLGRVDAAVGSQSGLQNAIDVQGINTADWPPPFELGRKKWWLHLAKNSKHQNLIPSLARAVEKIYRPNLIYELYMQQIVTKKKQVNGRDAVLILAAEKLVLEF